jgi:hypothetical protein
MKTTLIITALMIALPAVKTCKGADWSMGTPDARYPMDGGSTQTANERANREYEIAHHMVAVDFTNDEVLRAWGKEDEITADQSRTGERRKLGATRTQTRSCGSTTAS